MQESGTILGVQFTVHESWVSVGDCRETIFKLNAGDHTMVAASVSSHTISRLREALGRTSDDIAECLRASLRDYLCRTLPPVTILDLRERQVGSLIFDVQYLELRDAGTVPVIVMDIIEVNVAENTVHPTPTHGEYSLVQSFAQRAVYRSLTEEGSIARKFYDE